MSRQRKPVPEEIRVLSQRVERWRQSRTKRAPMPARLWEAAIEAARAHGISAVARGASIGYESLRQRCEVSEASGRKTEVPPVFVELEPMSSVGDHFSVPTSGAVIELRDGHGAQVVIRLGPGRHEAVDVSAMVTSLWNREVGSSEG